MKILKYSLSICVILLFLVLFWQWQITPAFLYQTQGATTQNIGTNAYVDLYFYAAFDQLDEIDVNLQLPDNYAYVGKEISLAGLSKWRYRLFFQAYTFEEIDDIPVIITIGEDQEIKESIKPLVLKPLSDKEDNLTLAPDLSYEEESTSLYTFILPFLILIIILLIIVKITVGRKQPQVEESSIIKRIKALESDSNQQISDDEFIIEAAAIKTELLSKVDDVSLEDDLKRALDGFMQHLEDFKYKPAGQAQLDRDLLLGVIRQLQTLDKHQESL